MQKVKGMDEPVPDDILREINKCVWTIGYTGQSPERLQAHMRNMGAFDVKTLKAKGGQGQGNRLRHHRGLLRPALALLRHAGVQAPGLAQPVRHHQARDGRRRQLPRQLRRGADGVNLLAEDGSHSVGPTSPPATPSSTTCCSRSWAGGTNSPRPKSRGRGQELEDRQLGRHDPRGMKNHGMPPLRQCQGARAGLELPGPDPAAPRTDLQHRPDLVAKYPTHDDKKAFWRLPTLYKTLQQKNIADKVAEKFPLILTSGRLVEYEGGGEETRSNPWLAELQQEMPSSRSTRRRGREGHRNGDRVWLHTPTGAAQRAGAGHRARRAGHGLDAVPLLGPLAGRRHAGYYPNGRGARGARRGHQHRHDLRLRQRDHDARDQDDDLQHRKGIRKHHGTNEICL
jgi:formate dehydrogenase major subunit